MKKFLILQSCVFLCAIASVAQNVGIGTSTPAASAKLDIESNDKGILIPRMTMAQRLAIASPATGLLVYQHDASDSSFYWYNGLSWVKLQSEKSGWSLKGNNSTNPATDFIGTTDSIPFVIKAFNQKAGRIELSEFGSTFFGFKAGNSNISSPYYTGNTAMGSLALWSNTSGTQNVAAGNNALLNNISGSLNVASGYNALYSNSSGDRNTGIGFQALVGNTTGNHNTAVGYWALAGNHTGYGNVAVGSHALWANYDKSNLVAVGDSALYNNGQLSPQPWQATRNTAVGSKALFSNYDGYELTAAGHRSLYSNTSGYNNTAFGSLSMEGNTTGNYNTAMGYSSLNSNTYGSENTAVGMFSMTSSTTGSYNTALGRSSLSLNQTGSYNTGIGYQSLYFNRHSQYNTALGYRAGNSFDIGWNNTIIGADADVSFNGQYNSIAIGNTANCPDNSTVRIGNSANWSYGGYANWTNISDGRYKKNISNNVAGLQFILKLRPVTYQMDVTGLSEKLNEGNGRELDETMKTAIAEKEKMIWTGFVAQEVESSANEMGFVFSGVDKPRNANSLYGLRYAEFVVPLVKAVQEQQQIINEMRRELELLKEQNKLLWQAMKE